ncbi:response regulator transcription factor [Flavobacterium sp. P4023]|uniref:Response regulator transcription factor n=1 Tax=Flavobacterium flabelliforme TaxID=2816119 RepID=A0ABS5CTU9_9FLAO|nr:response regulator [Flavobacterium flabelliforme]MBP4142051.1 response regulator transcription factor [Flavobacterium flabelliforme]
MPLKILLVDDHIMITDFYKMALADLKTNTEITTTNTLETAYNIIFDQNEIQPIDIIILDLSMPPYLEKNINNGEDLAKLIRSKYPELKIIIITSIFKSKQLERIIETFSPEGILEKIDITNSDYLINTLNKIIKGEFYRSEMVEKSIKMDLINDSKFDILNKQIITLLSQGVKTKNLPNHLSMTLSAINKRKSKIKQLLQIEKGDDEDIVSESKKNGII